MRETVLAEVAQRSPTSPETNLESRAMQVRVPWTQAWLCTKDFRRKCTGAGVACKVAVPSNAAQREDVPRRAGGCRVVSMQKDCKQTLLAPRVAVKENGCFPCPGRTRRSPLGRGDRGGTQHHREPTQKQAAPAEALEQAFKKSEHVGRLNTTKEGPTKPVVDSAS
ncbi:hypothetical protein NDU88_004729 [Pleurodeles waltl]|uniref:Uncharacterized protein n=1 Tax=Pleurodeles waltl TaxID=8319 RepID=A0AAV7V4D8_PLEWA|nr:hypothetical protein NDU88_004729 [Pleurodeles waltl]